MLIVYLANRARAYPESYALNNAEPSDRIDATPDRPQQFPAFAPCICNRSRVEIANKEMHE